MLISFERTMRKELWKRIWWMRQGSSKQQPKVSDNWIYSGISRCQIKEHFTALAINAKPTFFDLSLFFFAHTGIIFVKHVWFCFHIIKGSIVIRSSFQAYFKFFSRTETLGYKISDLWKSKATTATRDQFLLQWEKVMWLISSTPPPH